jgi:hypothetical protein
VFVTPSPPHPIAGMVLFYTSLTFGMTQDKIFLGASAGESQRITHSSRAIIPL